MHGRICLQIYALRDHLVQEMEHELVGPNTCCIVCKTAHGAFDTRGLRIKWLDYVFYLLQSRTYTRQLRILGTHEAGLLSRAASVQDQ